MIRRFDNLIRIDRQRRGCTLEEFASPLGYTGPYWGKVERVEVLPNQKMLNILSHVYGYSLYSLLVSSKFGAFSPTIHFGRDVIAETIPASEMESLLASNKYEISANIVFNHKIQGEALESLAASTGISKERLESIRESFTESGIYVTLEEIIHICCSLNKKFSEIFVITSEDIFDKDIGNLAYTVETYVEQNRATYIRNFPEIDDKLTDDEQVFLIEMLKSYRLLKLKPQLDQ